MYPIEDFACLRRKNNEEKEKGFCFSLSSAMAPAGKVTGFHKEGNDWFCNAGLPSDITVVVDGIKFHLHKFPLVSKCGKIARICEESSEKALVTVLEEFPGGPDTFLIAVKFCYGLRMELTPRNIVMVYCVADYLQMMDEYGYPRVHSVL